MGGDSIRPFPLGAGCGHLEHRCCHGAQALGGAGLEEGSVRTTVPPEGSGLWDMGHWLGLKQDSPGLSCVNPE